MRKILLLTLITTAIFVQTCFAKDVWVDHWNYENVDIYVMDDTLRHGISDSGKWFAVSTKEVKNGKLQKVINWQFSQFHTDMWRYETSTMDGRHTTVVIPKSNLFEYCMNKIGWTFTVKDQQGIRYYY